MFPDTKKRAFTWDSISSLHDFAAGLPHMESPCGFRRISQFTWFSHVEGLFLVAVNMGIPCKDYLQRFASTGRASDRKIAEPGGGKRVRRVRPDRLVNKNCSFIWEFTGRSLKTGHFSPVFGVFDPSGSHPASAADPRRPPPLSLHGKAIFEEKRRFA